MDWRQSSRCRYEDPEVFFPVGTGSLTYGQIDQAKAVCGRCPVVEKCLQWALDAGQVEGVWGGTTERERRAMVSRETRRRTSARLRRTGLGRAAR
ncbi:WhiB family transcriptional regulator [Streptomyces sp. NPDC008238]